MNIKPTTVIMEDFLSVKKQYEIPYFQREYSWDKNNYKEFFNDIVNCLKIKNKKLEVEPYFFGTMLFVEQDAKANSSIVVDGQQRLTIITIILSALSLRFLQAGEEVFSELIFDYIMPKDKNGLKNRILVTHSNYPYFRDFIQMYDCVKAQAKIKDPEKYKIPEVGSEEEEAIKETYQYMYEQLDEKN